MQGRTLYLGLNPPKGEEGIVHFPVIRIEPRSFDDPSVVQMMEKWGVYTHLVFTSRSAVRALDTYCQHYSCDTRGKVGIAVGQATAREMKNSGFTVDYVAEREQAEGLIELLDTLPLNDSFILWPHSALSRSVLSDYFQENSLNVADVVVYDTVAVDVTRDKAPDLDLFDKIIFTSPSTVDAFVRIYGTLDVTAELVAIGPITREAIFLSLTP